jgi:RHS repeat-associated protein
MDPLERLSAWPDSDAEGNPLPHNQQVRAAEQRAAETAARHAATPSAAHFDGMGRRFLTIRDNGRDEAGVDRFLFSRVEMDIEGNERRVIDAMGRTVQIADYDLLSNLRRRRSMDAGERRTLTDVLGHTIYSWDDRDHRLRHVHDALRRPTHVFVSAAGAPEILARHTVYGETRPDPETQNLRRRVYQVCDAAGVVSHTAYDFKGNLLASRREFRREYAATADWSQDLPLEPEAFESATTYDAFNRATIIVAPHSNRLGATLDVIQPGYDEAGRPRRVDVWLGLQAAPPAPLDPGAADLHVVAVIDYDAKGQRTRIECGNGAVTDYDYDAETFRLVHLSTTRPGFPSGRRRVQDLRYSYDPVGNISSIRDDAQQAIFFDNAVVEAKADYDYDATYRLIRATGREHQGQPAGAPVTWNEAGRTNLAHPHDGSRMRRYTEEYGYDEAGNILTLIHQAIGGGWTQTFSYAEPSLLQPERSGNRLSGTAIGDVSETCDHDAHGNMTRMSHLPAMAWDFEDHLVRTERQVVNGGTPERTFYVYDAAGARIRKITERQNGRRTDLIHLGGFEVAREYEGETLTLERQSLHVMDDSRRIAMVETRTPGDDGSPQRLIRFLLDNHLESASVELDELGETISYEEYYAYGSTSYQAMNGAIRAAAKRYRFSGKERDEETGLYHFGARYYACWLGRWTAADPAGIADGLNPFAYARANPVMLRDPTGSTNVPATSTDRRIMLMTDAQLHQHLKSLSPEARANFARGATGMFATRAWATLNRAGMAIGYELPADTITASPPKPKPKPAPQPQKSGSPASLPNVEHPEAWTPPAVVRKGWERLIDEAANSSNPWYARAGAGLGAIVGIVPTGGEVILHGIIAAPQLAVTETIAAGEHYARGKLLSEQGSDEAALDEYLAAAQAGSEGTANAATTVAVVGGGVQAVRGKVGTVDPYAAGERPPSVDPLPSTEPAPPPSKPVTDPYVPSEPAPPSQPPSAPPVDPLGPTQPPGPWAPDRYIPPGADPLNPRIPRPPRPPNIPKIDYD